MAGGGTRGPATLAQGPTAIPVPPWGDGCQQLPSSPRRPSVPPPPQICAGAEARFRLTLPFSVAFWCWFFFFFLKTPKKAPNQGWEHQRAGRSPGKGRGGGGQGGVGSPPACGAQNWGVLGNTWPRHMPTCCHVAPGHDAAVGKLRHEARLGCSCGRACSCAWMSWGGHTRVWLAGVGIQGQGTRVCGARLA